MSYSNVMTSVTMKYTSVERHISLAGNIASTMGINTGEMACGGIGAMICSTVMEGGLSGGSHLSKDHSFLLEYNEETQSSQFTSAWSYTTSDEPEIAGSSSDVVVVPNINVEFLQGYRGLRKIAQSRFW